MRDQSTILANAILEAERWRQNNAALREQKKLKRKKQKAAPAKDGLSGTNGGIK